MLVDRHLFIESMFTFDKFRSLRIDKEMFNEKYFQFCCLNSSNYGFHLFLIAENATISSFNAIKLPSTKHWYCVYTTPKNEVIITIGPILHKRGFKWVFSPVVINPIASYKLTHLHVMLLKVPNQPLQLLFHYYPTQNHC